MLASRVGDSYPDSVPTNEISQYLLRTTDAAAATAFYDAVLGRHGDAVFPLHEQALARGARPHWLGVIDTAAPEAAAAPFVAQGAQPLGPRPGGGLVLRDPGGALIAFGTVASPSTAGVIFHVLRTRQAARAAELYRQTFGWSFGEPDGAGVRPLAWRVGANTVGAMAGVEETPAVHPQWLYFFGVASLDEAVGTAQAQGASMLPSSSMPDGRRYAIGDDPQGAAFGLMERDPG